MERDRSFKTGAVVEEILTRALFAPVSDLLSRPGKSLRSRLVALGYLLSSENQERALPAKDSSEFLICQRLGEALEAVHAGSLIIDDIEDGSRERRGEPTLHERFGLPTALNTGNFLYFEPLHWIGELDLDPKVELSLYQVFHSAMRSAHLGQAIDLGTSIDQVAQEKVKEISLSSLRLKTGSLTALAINTGAIFGGANAARMSILNDFGIRFGIALQMFDDIGNVLRQNDDPKRLEDLRLKRPSWVWAVAAETLKPASYAEFVLAARALPDEQTLSAWLKQNDLMTQARTQAHEYCDKAVAELRQSLEKGSYPHGLDIIDQLLERIRTAYG